MLRRDLETTSTARSKRCQASGISSRFPLEAFAMAISKLKSAEQYADLMQEAKARLTSLKIVLNADIGLPAIAVQDFGYIQLRMLCELIALACIVAHGNMAPTKAKLRNEWRAGKIISELGKAHSGFFPRSATQKIANPPKIIVRKTGDPVSKDELKRLHASCGHKLHRGDVSALDKISEKTLTANLNQIVQWTSRLTDLLGTHVISLVDRKTIYLCTLSTAPDGRVSFSRLVKQQVRDERP
jgi:hypothetical protein